MHAPLLGRISWATAADCCTEPQALLANGACKLQCCAVSAHILVPVALTSHPSIGSLDLESIKQSSPPHGLKPRGSARAGLLEHLQQRGDAAGARDSLLPQRGPPAGDARHRAGGPPLEPHVHLPPVQRAAHPPTLTHETLKPFTRGGRPSLSRRPATGTTCASSACTTCGHPPTSLAHFRRVPA